MCVVFFFAFSAMLLYWGFSKPNSESCKPNEKWCQIKAIVSDYENRIKHDERKFEISIEKQKKNANGDEDGNSEWDIDCERETEIQKRERERVSLNWIWYYEQSKAMNRYGFTKLKNVYCLVWWAKKKKTRKKNKSKANEMKEEKRNKIENYHKMRLFETHTFRYPYSNCILHWEIVKSELKSK